MSYGLSIDNQENLWLTDAAMHQVFEYKDGKLLLRLDELFKPGFDSSYSCKPTDVVVSNDGYCNSRIIKFNSEGKFFKEYEMLKRGK